MQNLQEKSKVKDNKERHARFERKQAEAFRQFMKAHFGDPPCKECLVKI